MIFYSNGTCLIYFVVSMIELTGCSISNIKKGDYKMELNFDIHLIVLVIHEVLFFFLIDKFGPFLDL